MAYCQGRACGFDCIRDERRYRTTWSGTVLSTSLTSKTPSLQPKKSRSPKPPPPPPRSKNSDLAVQSAKVQFKQYFVTQQ